MRIVHCVLGCSLLASSLSLVACGKDPAPGSGSDTDTGTGTDSTGEATTSTSTTSTTNMTGMGSCVPGMSVGCACPDGGMGAQVCNPDGMSFSDCECAGTSMTSTTSMTTVTTDPSTTGDPMTTGEPMTTGSTGAMSGSSSGGGGVCGDPGPEPNEDEMNAVDLGDIDCQSDPVTLNGLLDGANDVDWFKFHGVWIQDCGTNDPVPELQINANPDVRLCAYAVCDMSMVAPFQCQNGSMADMSPDGLPGCCNTGGPVAFQVNCSMNPDESAQLFVRVDQGQADMCIEFSVDYGYQPG